jgi:hypothetical protein
LLRSQNWQQEEEIVRRLAVVIVCALVLPVSVARAWTWPVEGPVLRPFNFDRAHPYAGGQHRGVDLGAPTGASVLAPAEGVVSFAGTVPNGGKTVSIETPFGYTATLVHLGSIGAKRGALVGEGSIVGTVGPSGVVELADPFVYFGVRLTSDPQGYVDPLTLLPSRAAPVPPSTTGIPATAVAPPADVQPADVPAAAAPTRGVAELPTAAKDALAGTTPVAAVVPAAPALPATPAVPATPVEPAHMEAPAQTAQPAQPAPVAIPGLAEQPASVVTSAEPSLIHAEAPATTPGWSGLAPQVVLPSLGSTGIKLPLPFVSATTAATQTSSRMTAASSRDATRGTTPHTAARESLPRSHRQPPVRSDATHAAHAGSAWWRHLLLPLSLALLTLAARLVLGRRRREPQRAARIMSLPEPEQCVGEAVLEEDSGRAGLAVRGREATPGPRGRLRRAGGHLRPVPPVEGERRPDGERDGRARHAGDGHGGSRRRLAA